MHICGIKSKIVKLNFTHPRMLKRKQRVADRHLSVKIDVALYYTLEGFKGFL